MDIGKRFTELTGVTITDIIQSVVRAVADKSSRTLQESRHAPAQTGDRVAVDRAPRKVENKVDRGVQASRHAPKPTDVKVKPMQMNAEAKVFCPAQESRPAARKDEGKVHNSLQDSRQAPKGAEAKVPQGLQDSRYAPKADGKVSQGLNESRHAPKKAETKVPQGLQDFRYAPKAGGKVPHDPKKTGNMVHHSSRKAENMVYCAPKRSESMVYQPPKKGDNTAAVRRSSQSPGNQKINPCPSPSSSSFTSPTHTSPSPKSSTPSKNSPPARNSPPPQKISATTPLLQKTTPTKSSTHSQPGSHPSPTMAPRVANVDDTAGFMAAVRAMRLANGYGSLSEESSEQDAPAEAVEAPAAKVTSNYDELAEVFQPQTKVHEPSKPATDLAGEGAASFAAADDFRKTSLESKNDSVAASAVASPRAQTPVAEKAHLQEEEDRENLKTFKEWGTPEVRGKPAAQVRRVVIRGLPASWATPDKVLSLIHGGVIESVSVTPSGNAHILFCDAAACKAFYDKYPNGIDLDKERKYTVFVDMGKEVDVVSSQLSFNLSVGATRVVRAVGVDMEVTMSQLMKISSANNRKVEKIIDSYVPGYARSVNFRFCSIEDAVRFRAALVRNEDWEHCNVQYATDPCEVATGYHAD